MNTPYKAEQEYDMPHKPTQKNIKRKLNHKYYFKEDPMVVFQVEDQLFKVHQHHLAQESEHFRQMFTRATLGNDEQPILLPGVTVEEFESLLDYFYRPHAARTLQFYLDLLSVSHRFQMPEIFRFSEETLEPRQHDIQPLKRLVLGDKYGIGGWASSAFNDFLIRKETLSAEEAMALGFERFVNFVALREQRLEAEVVGARKELDVFRTQGPKRAMGRRRIY